MRASWVMQDHRPLHVSLMLVVVEVVVTAVMAVVVDVGAFALAARQACVCRAMQCRLIGPMPWQR